MTDELTRDTAGLFTVAEVSPPQALSRLAGLVTRRVPGCSGATATLWDTDEVVATAATHPDLAALAERQFRTGGGPIIAVLSTGEPAVTPDTLHEHRWPDFSAAALAAGVRSQTTIVQHYDSMSLTLSLYGVRPGAFDLDVLPLASLLAAFGTAMVAGAAEFGRARRTTSQLDEAIRSRAVVDQAKGVLMQLLDCDGDQAFERLRHISQTQHVKLTEVARRVIEKPRATGAA